jgi:putative ABC transport system permease protein
MPWIAFKILTEDRKKYLIIMFGVAFASMMMAHQMSVFCGVMRRTVNQILDVHPNGIWVMDPCVQYVDEIKPLPETALDRVRSVPGTAWAVPLYKGLVRVQTAEGNYRQTILFGLDEKTLFGAPKEMLLGTATDLRRPDGVIVDKAGYSYLWPGQELRLHRAIEINEHRAVLVGICEASPPFQTLPIMYTRYQEGIRFALRERHGLSFILVKARPGMSTADLCQRIQDRTGLMALTADEFSWKTINYYVGFTGIPINFGIVVFLGFVVGVAIAGQNFYLFTVENLRQFGVLKAIGVTNGGLIGMIVLQAMMVAVVGFGWGMGLVALLIEVSTLNIPHLAGFYLPWQVMALTGLAIVLIMVLSSLLSIRRVLILEPVAIFRE